LGPESNYAVKRIMHLSDMQLSGVHCMYDLSDAAAASTMLSAIFLVQETVMNLRPIFSASFW